MTAIEFSHRLNDLKSTLKLFTRKFTSDSEESMDLVQDTLLKALRYRDKFKQDINLQGWLFTIMRNTFINNYRKNRRLNVARSSSFEAARLTVSDDHTFTSPDKTFEYDDIWKNVHQLPHELLMPFKMYTSGYKYCEIAEHLNIPIGTVKNRIFNARKELQKKLAGY